MSDNVIILGAGFSHSSGIPLMSGLVEKMWEFAVRKTNGKMTLSPGDLAVFESAIKVRNELDTYHGRAHFDDRNIEDILSILSFRALNGRPTDRRKLKGVISAITKTIELCCKVVHPGIPRGSEYKVITEGPEEYRNFWRHLFTFVSNGKSLPTIITFNYDLVLERSLIQLLIGTNYNNYNDILPFRKFRLQYYYPRLPDIAFSVQYREFRSFRGGKLEAIPGTIIEPLNKEDGNVFDIEILKLHGSVNFPSHPLKADKSNYNFVESLPAPYILPPIFDKLSSGLPRDMWKVALDRLQATKNVIIVGYSLPKTDIYMQYFLKASLGPNLNLNKIIVFDPVLYSEDRTNNDMRARYEACFSPQLRNRIFFRPNEIGADYGNCFPGTLDHFVNSLKIAPNRILF